MTEGPFPPLLVICGPTAAGKTHLSLALAEALAARGVVAEILSADSRQVYRGMDIGTAKASLAEQARVPHHGLDLVDPDEPFTAADYRRHALGVLAAIATRGALALLVGGSGLYLRVVARDVPLERNASDPQVRGELEARLAAEGLAPLVAELRDIAPDRAADVDLANPRRVVRALERARLLGDRPLPAPRGYPGPSAWLGLRLEPSELADRIEARARAQFAAGLVEEAAELRKRFGAGHRSFGAFGYREALALADGLIDEEAAIAADAARTRAFARRQRTWFRGEPGIAWLAGGGEDEMAGSALETAVEAAERLLETRPVS